MRDIAPVLTRWADEGRRFALARVLKTWGSAPRRVGSAMAVTEDRSVVGSVSGGCVEGEVIDAAAEVIETGKARILDFGVTNDMAWSAGLSCGGRISVLVERFPVFSDDAESGAVGREMLGALAASLPFVWLRTLPPGPAHHLLVPISGNPIGDHSHFGTSAIEQARVRYTERQSGLFEMDEVKYFVHSMPARSTLLIVGATDIATHLVRIAQSLEFETVVVDPRAVFTATERFSPAPDRLITTWPQEAFSDLGLGDETYAVLLSHDPKIDDPALHILLRSNVTYIGALGSSKTHARRLERLSEAGFAPEQGRRIHGPVGLDIGASSPAEIALSVMAQVVHARNRQPAS